MSTKRHLYFAATAMVLCSLLHRVGGPEASDVLSGTAPLGPSAWLGLAYVLSWFAAVLLAPITLLAAAIERGLSYALGRPCSPPPSAQSPRHGA